MYNHLLPDYIHQAIWLILLPLDLPLF